jgi:thiaminase/transcriptional activator TenA
MDGEISRPFVSEIRCQVQLSRAFLMQKYNSYQKYNATFPSIWHVDSTASIVPFGVCTEYANWETSIAGDAQLDPIYIVIAMLPCDYLWAWLAAQLAQLPPTPGNLYAPWITDNNSPKGAYGIRNFLVHYSGEIDPAIANTIYQTAINYELQNFLAGDPPPAVKGA